MCAEINSVDLAGEIVKCQVQSAETEIWKQMSCCSEPSSMREIKMLKPRESKVQAVMQSLK